MFRKEKQGAVAYAAAPYIFSKENRMKVMNDFTKSNKWLRFKKKMQSPTEKELVDYIELLERQIQTLEDILNNYISGDDGK